jgi:hypothetical protein
MERREGLAPVLREQEREVQRVLELRADGVIVVDDEQFRCASTIPFA